LLKSTGIAGTPQEYFEAQAATGLPPHPGDYLKGLRRTGAGIRDDVTPSEAPEYSDLRGLADYRQHLDRTFRLGTTPNGVFASKLMWSQVGELRRLAAQLPEFRGVDPTHLLDQIFGHPAYVWVRRRDKVRQAISLWRALQTRTWRAGGDPEQPSEPVPRYSFEGIDHLVRRLRADDQAWVRYFGSHGLNELTIFYEDDLERDWAAATSRALAHIGVPVPEGWRPAEPTARQADSLTEQWLESYRRDAFTRRRNRMRIPSRGAA
jgi:LPS sulfotransferase NodH